jgi:hypothetical protein
MKRIGALLVLVAVPAICAVLLAPPARALTSAPTVEPWQSDVCWSSACVWSPSLGDYVAGGDGVSISDYIGGSWGTIPEIERKAATIESLAADELPAFETVPALSTIVLAATTFQIGWRIGSSIDHKWLHLAGIGLGTNAPTVTGVRLQYLRKNPSSVIPAGSQLNWNNGTTWWAHATDKDYHCGSASEPQAWRDFFFSHTNAPYEIVSIPIGDPGHVGGCLANMPDYVAVIPRERLGEAIVVDQPVQTDTGQAAGTQTGWKVVGGCGDTLTACNYPGSQGNPTVSVTKLRCELSGDSAYCSGAVPIPVSPDGSGFYGGAGSSGAGLGLGPEGDLNCRADPADYACPAEDASGTTFTSGGGPIVDWTMPDCWRLSVSGCEEAITVAASAHHASIPSFTFAVATDDFSDLWSTPGVALYTSPDQSTSGQPGSVVITTNEDPLPAAGGDRGGDDSGDGNGTTSAGGECSFFTGQGLTWADALALDSAFYQDECDAARQTFWASINAAPGELPQTIIDTAKVIVSGAKLAQTTNQSVIDELTAGGRSLDDWDKVTTDWFTTPAGREFQVHFYRYELSSPQEANLNIDFKVRFRKVFYP